jgi:uncharacterized protein (TIGR02145 family)
MADTANILLRMPASLSFVPIPQKINPNSSFTINLTPWIDSIENKPANKVLNYGLLLTSDKNITAYYEVADTNNPAVSSMKGKNALGTEFYISGQTDYPNQTNDGSEAFDIVATEDNTHVMITPSLNIIGHIKGITFEIILNKGQTYSARTLDITASASLAGSHVVSDKPIAITIMDDSIITGGWDEIADQTIPINLLGWDYIVIKGYADNVVGNNDEHVYILAIKDNTDIFLDGSTVPATTLNTGIQYDYSIPPANNTVRINATNPVYVYHLSGHPGEAGSAIIPQDSCTGSRQVGFTRSTAWQFALLILTRNGNQGSFLMNGDNSIILASDFNVVLGTGNAWVYYRKNNIPVGQVPVGANQIINTSGKFHLGILNMIDNGGSSEYGYFSDFSSLYLGPDKSLCPGDSITLDGGLDRSSYEWKKLITGTWVIIDTNRFLVVHDSGYYAVMTNGDFCELRDTIHIGLYPSAIVNLGPDTTLCEGASITLDPGPFVSYHWQNGFIGRLFTTSLAGLYWVEVTNNNGCKATDTIVISVDSLPKTSGVIAGLSPVCQGQNGVIYSVNPFPFAATYSWTLPSGATGASTTNSITVDYSIAALSDTIRVKGHNACGFGPELKKPITVNPLPTATITGTIAVCKNSTSPLVTFTGASGTAPYTFTYNINGLPVQTVTTTVGNSVTVAAPTNAVGTFTYNLVSVQDGSPTACSQPQTGSAVVTINPLPTATIAGTITVCKNSTSPLITFTGASTTAPYTFTYNINGSPVQTVTTTIGNSVTVAAPTNVVGTFTYNLVSVQDGSSTACSQLQTGSAVVTVNPLPTATITGTIAVCQNSTSPLITFTGASATAPYTFTYNINGLPVQTVTTIVGNSVTVAAPTNSGGTFTYNLVSVQDGSSTACSQPQTGSATVTVNPLPVPSITGPGSVCLNSTGTYSTESSMTNYVWTVSAGGTIASGTGTNSINILWSATGAKTITVNYHDANGCTATTPSSLSVNVSTLPVPALNGLNPICSGSSTTYSTDAGMTNYSWLVSAGGTITAGGGTANNSVTITWNTAGAQTVSVNYTMGTGCTATNPTVLNVIVKPKPSVTNASNYTICSGATTNISLLASLPGTTFTWTATGSSGNVSGFSASGGPVISQTLINSGFNIETVDYAVTPSLNGCDGTVAHYIVTVDPVADAYFNPNGQTLCSGGTSSISILSHVAGATFIWTATGSSGNISGFGPGATSSIAQTLTNAGTAPGTVTYTISPSFNSCPGTPNSITVTVNPLPPVSFTPCNDLVTTTAAAPFVLKGGVPLGGTYSGAGIVSGIFYPSLAGTGSITQSYSYTNTWGCTVTINHTITVISVAPFTCGNILTDPRDSHIYPTVELGTQCWMAANLDYGSAISSTQFPMDNCTPEKYCFNDNPSNCSSYGGLYIWDELMQYEDIPAVQGFCPPGWHVPDENEWNVLFNLFISNGFAGSPLKYTGYTGFNALLDGLRFKYKAWGMDNFATLIWSSSSHGSDKAWAHGMNSFNPSVSFYPASKSNAFVVRCVKD